MLEKYFCSAPWIHMRIKQNGNLEYCRHADDSDSRYNIRNISLEDYFKEKMSELRSRMLAGLKTSKCHTCYTMEENGKVSGRQKALLKTGIDQQYFRGSFHSSTYFKHFNHSHENNGNTDLMPVDWQIDLGNYCNSACIMCNPMSSSRLAREWYELGLSDQKPRNDNWVDDPLLFEKFVNGLCSIKNLRYLHFIGGETVITPGFIKILERLIKLDLNKEVILGFTTNLTVYDQNTIDMLKEFKDVHVGLSIETMNSINDYIRWPSKIESVKLILDKWIEASKRNGWNVTIRPTPNVLSVSHIYQLYDYVLRNNIGIESCNFMYRPEYLKVSVLPMRLREDAILKIKKVVNISAGQSKKIFNIRNPNTYKEYVTQDAMSLIKYLENEPYDTSNHPALINFLKIIESKRKNKIIEHIPEYEEFFRSIGY